MFTATPSTAAFFNDYFHAHGINSVIYNNMAENWTALCDDARSVIVDLDDFFNAKCPEHLLSLGVSSARDRQTLLRLKHNGWHVILFKPLNAKNLAALLLPAGNDIDTGHASDDMNNLQMNLKLLCEQNLRQSAGMLEVYLQGAKGRSSESFAISAANEAACRLATESKHQLAIKFLTAIFPCTLRAQDSYILQYNLSSLHLGQREIELANKYYDICVSNAPSHFKEVALLKRAILNAALSRDRRQTDHQRIAQSHSQRTGAFANPQRNLDREISSRQNMGQDSLSEDREMESEPVVPTEEEIKNRQILEFILFKTDQI